MEISNRSGGWCTEPDGVIALEAGALRAVLTASPASRYVRFLVLAQPGEADQADGRGPTPALLASGTEESVPAAMRAAERALARIAGSSGDRRAH